MNIIYNRIISTAWWRILVALIAALLMFMVLIYCSGRDASQVMRVLIMGGWGSTTALTESVVKAIPIMLCALGAALPARMGLINIGGEGQLIMGAVGATWVALNMAALSRPSLLALMVLAAVASGAIWGLLPGALRAMTRASEIVISLLLNYVAILFMLYLIHGPFKDPLSFGWAQSQAFGSNAILPNFTTTRIHVMLFVGLFFAVAFSLLIRRTIWGVAFRIINASDKSARYAGINVGKYYILAFAIGGSLAALAGLGEVSVIHTRLREGISMGYGYTGFLVAWLCSNRFILIPVASLLLGGLFSGADVLQISAGLPFATISILQGLLFLAVLVGEAIQKNKIIRET